MAMSSLCSVTQKPPGGSRTVPGCFARFVTSHIRPLEILVHWLCSSSKCGHMQLYNVRKLVNVLTDVVRKVFPHPEAVKHTVADTGFPKFQFLL